MRITLRISESLLSIYRAASQTLDENIVLELKGPMTIDQILARIGINPLLTPLISLDGVVCQLDQNVDQDAVITLIGPLAGG